MSEYPSHWSVRPLEEIAERVRRTSDDQNLDVLTISSTEGWVDQRKKWARDMAGKSIEKYTLLEEGEFSYNRGNSKTYPQGCIFRLETWDRALVPNVYHSFSIASPEIDGTFLRYFFAEGGLNDQLRSVITSSVRDNGLLNITADTFFSSEVPIPPLPEQKKIAEILSGIDGLIVATQRKIDRIRIAHEGLANSWQMRVSLEKKEGILGDLIASIDSGWSPACDEVAPKSREWGVLKVSAVTKGYFCEEESKRLPSNLEPRDQFLVKKSDLLITRANGNLDLVGRGAIVEDEPAANLLMSDKILRLNANSYSDRNFLLLLLNSRHVRQQIETAVGGSTGAKNIGQGLLRQISISIPAAEDQVKIGNLSRSLSTTLAAGKKRLEYLTSLKKGLSSDLLSGRKRVNV